LNSRRVEELKRNLAYKDTVELLEIWSNNDRKSYIDETFEAIRLILTERGVAIPQQHAYVPIEEKVTWCIPKGSRKKTAGGIVFFVGIVIISLSFIWLWSKRGGYWWGDLNLYCFVGEGIGLLLTIIGALLFSYGKFQEIAQRNNLKVDDSQKEHEKTALPRGYGKKVAGMMLLATGITGIIMGLLIFFVSCSSMPNMDTPEDFDTLFTGFLSGVVGIILTIIGAILDAVGRSQLKKQKNQNIP
jgi:hypothetical protein